MKRRQGSPRPLQSLGVKFGIALILLSGGCCRWTDKEGTHHVLIIGAGLVSINNSNPSAATITSKRIVGLAADGNSIAAGYSSSLTTAIPSGAEDVRIEVSKHRFAPLTIEVQKAQLNQTNITKGVQ